MIKLIATDIDGTLLEEGTDTLNEEIYNLVLELKKKGAVFAAASGRQYASIYRLFEPVANEMIFVAENGAYIVCRGQDIREIGMDRKMVEKLIGEIRSVPGCEIGLSCKGCMYIESSNPDFYDLLANGYHNEVEVVEDLLEIQDPVIKVAVYKESGAAGMFEQFADQWKDVFRVLISGEKWIDFTEYAADKGNAIEHIQKTLHFTEDETMVFGDNDNDIGMFAHAKYSYAIGNAKESVKEAARFIADTNANQGVLKVLKNYIENGRKETAD